MRGAGAACGSLRRDRECHEYDVLRGGLALGWPLAREVLRRAREGDEKLELLNGVLLAWRRVRPLRQRMLRPEEGEERRAHEEARVQYLRRRYQVVLRRRRRVLEEPLGKPHRGCGGKEKCYSVTS